MRTTLCQTEILQGHGFRRFGGGGEEGDASELVGGEGVFAIGEDYCRPALLDGAHVSSPPDGFAVRVASQETARSHHRYDRKRTEVRGRKSVVSSQRSVVSDWGSLAGESIVRRRGRGQGSESQARECAGARRAG
jgi:hypothetical protein